MCQRERTNLWRVANPETNAASNARSAIKNCEAGRASRARYRAEHLEARRAQSNAWKKTNPHKHCALNMKRQAAKLRRTPPWLTAEHFAEMETTYRLRDEIERRTGVAHNVDHIVPLQGKNVSGLHVPWNLQVLTKAVNLSKSNHF